MKERKCDAIGMGKAAMAWDDEAAKDYVSNHLLSETSISFKLMLINRLFFGKVNVIKS